ncbi:MAG: hypothetical protein NC201_06240, partial [Prevotella sp.]|nr:hypothetical protein [Prevotella sp.]
MLTKTYIHNSLKAMFRHKKLSAASFFTLLIIVTALHLRAQLPEIAPEGSAGATPMTPNTEQQTINNTDSTTQPEAIINLPSDSITQTTPAQPLIADSVVTIKAEPKTQKIVGDTIYYPDIIYSPMPKKYEIAGIKVTGMPGSDEYLIIGFSGLNVGDKIEIPGEEITAAVKRFWRQGLYSKIQIHAEKIVGDKVWLDIELKARPRMSEMVFHGAKSGEKKDLTEKLGMVSGQQLTPNIIAQAKTIIERYYSAKGFKNAVIEIKEVPDLSNRDYVTLNVYINRNNKVKVHKIYIDGNSELSDNKIKRAMKKTNENGNILNLFKQKKFVDQD